MMAAAEVGRLLDDEVLARAVGGLRMDVARAGVVELDDGGLLRVLLVAAAVRGLAGIDGRV